MYDTCKTCGNPIYPYGVSYSGNACSYHGQHPTQNQVVNDIALRKLTLAIRELTEAIKSKENL